MNEPFLIDMNKDHEIWLKAPKPRRKQKVSVQ